MPPIFNHRRLIKVFRQEEGSVAMLVGLILFLLILAVGVAVDMTRAQILQQRISASLDAAGLAAAEDVSNPPASLCAPPETVACAEIWASQEATRYFNANFPTGYLGSTLPASVPVTVSADLNTLDLSISATQQTVFMQTFGVNTMNVAATSEVTRSSNGQGMEVVMVLDNTLSMNDTLSGQTQSKIVALQNAASELVSILLGTTGTPPSNVWVGIVPFTQAVNVGGNITSASYDSVYNASLPFGPGSTAPNGTWSGCVTSRSGTTADTNGITYDISDIAPSATPGTLFQDYFFSAAQSGAYTPPDTNASCNADPFQLCAYNQWQTGPTAYNFGPFGGTGVDMGPNLFCPQQLTSMTSSVTALNSAINSMVPTGDTEIDIGLAWGWRLLSPNWNGKWTSAEMAANDLPLPYNQTNNKKVIVLMTDGTNFMDSGQYSAYGMYNAGTLGAGYTTIPSETPGCDAQDCAQAASLDLDARTQNVCNALKSQGVIIFTIGFGNPAPDNPPTYADRTDPTLVDAPLLTNCAGNGGVYYPAVDNSALQTAFQNIGNTLENIRISK